MFCKIIHTIVYNNPDYSNNFNKKIRKYEKNKKIYLKLKKYFFLQMAESKVKETSLAKIDLFMVDIDLQQPFVDQKNNKIYALGTLRIYMTQQLMTQLFQ